VGDIIDDALRREERRKSYRSSRAFCSFSSAFKKYSPVAICSSTLRRVGAGGNGVYSGFSTIVVLLPIYHQVIASLISAIRHKYRTQHLMTQHLSFIMRTNMIMNISALFVWLVGTYVEHSFS
jgi:hypothetical protein